MSEFVKIKTTELTGAALDWAVAEAIGWKEPIYGIGLINIDGDFMSMTFPDPGECIENPEPRHFDHYEQWTPSRMWSQAGPLILKYRVSLIYAFEEYEALIGMTHSQSNESPLIAACQAIVASVLGETVSVPKELL